MHAAHETGIRVEAIEPERPRPIQTPWGEFALFRIRDAVFCVQSFCPHLAGPLFQGTTQGETVTCPWHFWCFSLRTGERLDELEPAEHRTPLRRLAVEVAADGTILLTPPPGPAGAG